MKHNAAVHEFSMLNCYWFSAYLCAIFLNMLTIKTTTDKYLQFLIQIIIYSYLQECTFYLFHYHSSWDSNWDGADVGHRVEINAKLGKFITDPDVPRTPYSSLFTVSLHILFE
jgi:hypothetical protein